MQGEGTVFSAHLWKSYKLYPNRNGEPRQWNFPWSFIWNLTHYQMNYFLPIHAFNISTVLSGFQPPNFTQVLLQPSSTHLWLKPHNPINELAIVIALSQQLVAQTGKQASPLEMCAIKDERTVSQPRDGHAVCTLQAHPHTSPCPTLQRTL